MRYSPEFRFLKDLVAEQIKELEASLAMNNCATIEDYRFICGRIRGLKTADTIIDDLATSLENKE